MAKITVTDIKNMGFGKDMFGLATDGDLDTRIEDAITEQASLLSGKIGSGTYASTDLATAARVKRAEKCYVAAEMLAQRLVYLAGKAVTNGKEHDTRGIERQKTSFEKEAELIVELIGGGGGYAGSVSVSSHFVETPTTIGGLEVVG